MRLTIIKDENRVSIDGESRTVDCSGLPPEFHVLQWDSFRACGEVEFVAHLYANNPGQWHKRPNVTIFKLDPYQKYVDEWHAAGPKDQVPGDGLSAVVPGDHSGV